MLPLCLPDAVAASPSKRTSLRNSIFLAVASCVSLQHSQTVQCAVNCSFYTLWTPSNRYSLTFHVLLIACCSSCQMTGGVSSPRSSCAHHHLFFVSVLVALFVTNQLKILLWSLYQCPLAGWLRKLKTFLGITVPTTLLL